MEIMESQMNPEKISLMLSSKKTKPIVTRSVVGETFAMTEVTPYRYHKEEDVRPWSKTDRRDDVTYVEAMKRTMLKHEATFRVQVQELHRLYHAQRLLMSDQTMKSNKEALALPFCAEAVKQTKTRNFLEPNQSLFNTTKEMRPPNDRFSEIACQPFDLDYADKDDYGKMATGAAPSLDTRRNINGAYDIVKEESLHLSLRSRSDLGGGISNAFSQSKEPLAWHVPSSSINSGRGGQVSDQAHRLKEESFLPVPKSPLCLVSPNNLSGGGPNQISDRFDSISASESQMYETIHHRYRHEEVKRETNHVQIPHYNKIEGRHSQPHSISIHPDSLFQGSSRETKNEGGKSGRQHQEWIFFPRLDDSVVAPNNTPPPDFDARFFPIPDALSSGTHLYHDHLGFSSGPRFLLSSGGSLSSTGNTSEDFQRLSPHIGEVTSSPVSSIQSKPKIAETHLSRNRTPLLPPPPPPPPGFWNIPQGKALAPKNTGSSPFVFSLRIGNPEGTVERQPQEEGLLLIADTELKLSAFTHKRGLPSAPTRDILMVEPDSSDCTKWMKDYGSENKIHGEKNLRSESKTSFLVDLNSLPEDAEEDDSYPSALTQAASMRARGSKDSLSHSAKENLYEAAAATADSLVNDGKRKEEASLIEKLSEREDVSELKLKACEVTPSSDCEENSAPPDVVCLQKTAGTGERQSAYGSGEVSPPLPCNGTTNYDDDSDNGNAGDNGMMDGRSDRENHRRIGGRRSEEIDSNNGVCLAPNEESSIPFGRSYEPELDGSNLTNDKDADMDAEDALFAEKKETAEALVSLSLDNTTFSCGSSSPLEWFVGIVYREDYRSSSLCGQNRDPPHAIIVADVKGLDSNNAAAVGCHENDENQVGNDIEGSKGGSSRPLRDLDSFESATLMLKESRVECLDVELATTAAAAATTLEKRAKAEAEEPLASSNPRATRSSSRRGAVGRDFLRERLPSISSLSRLEIAEDLQIIGGLLRSANEASAAAAAVAKAKRSKRKKAQTGNEKGAAKKSRPIKEEEEEKAGAGAGAGGEERGNGNNGVYPRLNCWGEMTRRRRMQRHHHHHSRWSYPPPGAPVEGGPHQAMEKSRRLPFFVGST